MACRKFAFAAVAALLSASCATPPVETARAKPDPRQGAELTRICFKSEIKDWRKHDDRSVIIRVTNKNAYKLELMGACQPEDAFMSIGLDNRPASGCIHTYVTKVMGSCTIKKIYRWNTSTEKPTSYANSAAAAHAASPRGMMY